MIKHISKYFYNEFGPNEDGKLRTLRLILATFLDHLRLLFAKKLRTLRLTNIKCSYKKTGVY